MATKDKERKLATERAWREANRESLKAYQIAWRETNRQHLKAYSTAYCAANSEVAVKRVRDWRKANPGRRNASQRAHYAENRDVVRAIKRKWDEANREKKRAYYRNWYSKPENQAKDSAKGKRWRKSNPEKSLAHWRKSRAKRLKAEGHHSLKDLARIRKLQGDRCAMPHCRKPLNGKGHADHIVPLARGGTDWPKNLQYLCPKCNWDKNSKDPIDHIRSHGFLI